MKKVILLLLPLLAIACSKSDGPANPTLRPPYFIKVIKQADANKNELVSRLPIQLPGDILASLTDHELKIDAIEYHTVDPQGNNQVASGVITYPATGEFKGVVVAQHYTITKNSDAPSEAMGTTESILALSGYVVIAADYLGWGSSSALPHPYVHAENTAATTIDMLFAAREYMEQINRRISDSVTVVGYSQGGHAALAFQRMAERDFASKILIKRVLAGGGPYDLVASYDEFIKRDTTGYPCSIPMIMLGIDYGESLHLNYKNLFQEPLLSNYSSWILSKQYDAATINQKMGTNCLSKFLTAEALRRDGNADVIKLYDALKANSLVEWTPKAPIQLVHAVKDSYVPHINAQNAYNSFKARGCNVTLESVANTDHLGGAASFYVTVLWELQS